MNEITRKLDQVLKLLLSEENLLDIGNYAVSLIRKRTKIGYGVANQGGTKEKLLALSKSYKKQRKYKKLDSTTNQNKSNLTQTGQMLKDLMCWIENEVVMIGFQDDESLQKAGWVTKGEYSSGNKPRPFNNISEAEKKQISIYIQKKIDKLLKRLK